MGATPDVVTQQAQARNLNRLATEADTDPNVVRAFRTGLRSAEALAPAAKTAFAAVTGNNDLAARAEQEQQRLAEEASVIAPKTLDLNQAHTIPDYLAYVRDTAAASAPVLAPMMAATVLGGPMGRLVGAAMGRLGGPAVEAATAARVGTAAGAYAPGALLGTSQLTPELAQDEAGSKLTPLERARTASVGGAAEGAAFMVPFLHSWKRLGFGQTAENIVQQSLRSKVVQGALQTGGEMAGASAAATLIDRQTRHFVNQNIDVLSPEGLKEIINSSIGGAVGGAVLGGFTGALANVGASGRFRQRLDQINAHTALNKIRSKFNAQDVPMKDYHEGNEPLMDGDPAKIHEFLTKIMDPNAPILKNPELMARAVKTIQGFNGGDPKQTLFEFEQLIKPNLAQGLKLDKVKTMLGEQETQPFNEAMKVGLEDIQGRPSPDVPPPDYAAPLQEVDTGEHRLHKNQPFVTTEGSNRLQEERGSAKRFDKGTGAYETQLEQVAKNNPTAEIVSIPGDQVFLRHARDEGYSGASATQRAGELAAEHATGRGAEFDPNDPLAYARDNLRGIGIKDMPKGDQGKLDERALTKDGKTVTYSDGTTKQTGLLQSLKWDKERNRPATNMMNEGDIAVRVGDSAKRINIQDMIVHLIKKDVRGSKENLGRELTPEDIKRHALDAITRLLNTDVNGEKVTLAKRITPDTLVYRDKGRNLDIYWQDLAHIGQEAGDQPGMKPSDMNARYSENVGFEGGPGEAEGITGFEGGIGNLEPVKMDEFIGQENRAAEIRKHPEDERFQGKTTEVQPHIPEPKSDSMGKLAQRPYPKGMEMMPAENKVATSDGPPLGKTTPFSEPAPESPARKLFEPSREKFSEESTDNSSGYKTVEDAIKGRGYVVGPDEATQKKLSDNNFEPYLRNIWVHKDRIAALNRAVNEVIKQRGLNVHVDAQRLSNELADLFGEEGIHNLSGLYVNPDGLNRAIFIALNSKSPTQIAFHESLHDFFRTLPEDLPLKQTLLDHASSEHVMGKLKELLKDHPNALKQIATDPEERLAYLYQFWSHGLMSVKPEVHGIFQQIAQFIRNVLNLLNQGEKTEKTLTLLKEGKLADVSTAGEVLARELKSRPLEAARQFHENAREWISQTYKLNAQEPEVNFVHELLNDIENYRPGDSKQFNDKTIAGIVDLATDPSDLNMLDSISLEQVEKFMGNRAKALEFLKSAHEKQRQLVRDNYAVNKPLFIAEAKRLGIPNPEKYVDLEHKNSLAEKWTWQTARDPDTGKVLNARELMELMADESPMHEGGGGGNEFSRRRGYTEQEIADLAAGGKLINEAVKSGVDEEDIQWFGGVISGQLENKLAPPRSVKFNAEDPSYAAGAMEPTSEAGLHAILNLLRTDALKPKELAVLGRAFTEGSVRSQLFKLLEDENPEILRQIKEENNVDMAIAYGYKLWAHGDLTIGPETKTLFTKIRDTLAKALGVLTQHEQAESIFRAINSGLITSGDRNFELKRFKNENAFQKGAAGLVQASEHIGRVVAPFFPAQSRAYFMNNPVAIGITNMFQVRAGAESHAQDYFNSRLQYIGQFQKMLHESTKHLTKAEGTTLLEVLQNPSLTVNDPRINAARDDVRKVLREIRNYAVDRGMDIGDRGPDYFPWVMNTEALVNDRTGFVNLLAQEKFKDHLVEVLKGWSKNKKLVVDVSTPAARMAAAERIYNSLHGSDGVADVPMGDSDLPYNGHMNKRVLDFIRTEGNDEDHATFASFMSKDLGHTLGAYVDQMVKRAEFTQRFGRDGEKLDEKYVAMKKYGATDKDVAVMKTYVAAQMGTLGRDLHPYILGTLKALDRIRGTENTPEAWATVDPKKFRKFQGALLVYQNVRLLGLAQLGNICDIGGIAVRGDLESSFAALKAGLEEVTATLKGNKTALQELGETMGTVEKTMLNDALGQAWGSNAVTGTARKINDAFFKYSGTAYSVKVTRLMALAAGRKFLAKHGMGKEGTDTFSDRMLKQLDIKREDIHLDDGELKLLNEREWLNASAYERARDDRVKSALNRFVDEAIVRPNPSQRPLYGSHPDASLIFHLKTFIYGMHDRILRRVGSEMKQGNYMPMMALAGTYVPVYLASQVLRDIIKNQSSSGDSRKDNWSASDYLVSGAQGSGILGMAGLIQDARMDLRYGGTGLEHAAGPTAQQLEELVRAFIIGDRNKVTATVDALPVNNWYRRSLIPYLKGENHE